MKLSLTGNVLEAGVCYQKAIEQDPNKLANRVVCLTYRIIAVLLILTQKFKYCNLPVNLYQATLKFKYLLVKSFGYYKFQ